MAVDDGQKDTFNELAAYLQDLGLGSLFAVDADGNPTGWLWNQIVNGIDTAEQLAVSIENTDAFKTRYGVISEMRKRAAAGEPVKVPTIGEVREYEDTAAKVMRQAGMPVWFYDSYTDLQSLMGKDISVAELEQRVGRGWSMVRDADPAVREAFSNFYGIAQGDAALAAFILDPGKTLSSIERSSRAAYTAGYGRTMGVDVDKQMAERLSALPKTEAGISQDLGEVARMSNLYKESITETTDLTSQTGLEAVAFGNAEAQAQLQRRLTERQANDRATTGGAIFTQQGATGVRSV